MATILQIIAANDANIRQKTLPSSILKTEDSDMRDVVAIELRNRGIIVATTTGGLVAISTENTRIALVHNVGLFIAEASLAPVDNEILFASATVGWLWRKVISTDPGRDKVIMSADDEYDLASGYMIYEIWLKPVAGDMVKIGLTDGGDEIMLTDTLTAGQWKRVLTTVFADGAAKTLYFRGITDTTTVIILKRKI
jgi:hypothetical protein